MAKFYKKRKSFKKRPYKKGRRTTRYKKKSRRKSLAKSNPLTDSFNLIPANKVIKMRYKQDFAQVSTLGIHVFNTFRMNSIYDPNYTTSTGGQPLFHDEMAQFFMNYIVLGAKVITTFRWGKADSIKVPTVCFSIPDDDVLLTYPTTVEKELIYPRFTRVLKADPTASVSISTFFSCKKFFSIKDPTDQLNEVGAIFGANPTKVAYVHVGIQPIGAHTPGSVVCSTKIEYVVKCIQPKEPTMS